MLNLLAINNGVQHIVESLLNVTTIFEDQNAPRPEGDYLTLKLTSIQQLARREEGATNDQGLASVFAHYLITFSFNSFRENSKSLMEQLRFALNLRTVLDQFEALGLGFSNTTPIIDVPMLLQTEWEERSQMNAMFFVSDTDQDNIGFIQSTDIDGKFYNADGSLEKEVTLDIQT